MTLNARARRITGRRQPTFRQRAVLIALSQPSSEDVVYTRNDGAPFVAMDPRIARLKRLRPVGAVIEWAASAALTRRVFGMPARRLAEAWRGHGGRSATYRVDWSPPRAPMGACHCIELPLLFDAPSWADAPMLGGGPVDDRLAETMRRNWSGFAHDGIDGLDSPSLRFG